MNKIEEKLMDFQAWYQRQIGWFLYRIGFPYSRSTGIGGNMTLGFGELSDNGYWQYPCPADAFKEWIQR